MDGKARVTAKRIEFLRKRVGECRACHLHLYCDGPVPPSVPRETIVPQLLVIGEAPGQQEDKQRQPFVGPAGKLLDRLLKQGMGLSRQQVMISNAVQCRPTVAQKGKMNRAPNQTELYECRDNVARVVDHYAGVGGEWILLMGATALKQFVPWMKIGVWSGKPFAMMHERRLMNVMATYHPAAALRDDRNVTIILDHLKKLNRWKKRLDEWPDKCFCGGEVERYDAMGLAYCEAHLAYRKDGVRMMEVRKKQMTMV